MRRSGLIITFICTFLFVADSVSQAQGPGRPGQRSGARGPGGTQQTPPLLRVFDANGDGLLSKEEIDNASAALRKLDGNRDGILSAEELRPSGQGGRGAGGRGPGGPGVSRPGGQGGARPGGQGGRPGGSGGSGGNRGPGAGGGAGRGGDPAQADAAFAEQIKTLDENRDGVITVAELPEHMHAAFEIADEDKSGAVSDKELLTLAAQFRRNRIRPDGDAQIKNAPVGPNGRPGGSR